MQLLAKPCVRVLTRTPSFRVNSTATTPQEDPVAMPRPSGLIASKGLELLTWGTPNGHKATIILEELKEAYGKPEYVWQGIPIGENVQKEKWFTDLGPNGRIPVLVDHEAGSLGIMEGAAILSYLTRHFDPEHKLSFTSDPELSLCEQWIAWQHGGLGKAPVSSRSLFDIDMIFSRSNAGPSESVR